MDWADIVSRIVTNLILCFIWYRIGRWDERRKWLKTIQVDKPTPVIASQPQPKKKLKRVKNKQTKADKVRQAIEKDRVNYFYD